MQPINDPNANWGAAPTQPGMMVGQQPMMMGAQPAVFPVGQQPMMGGMMGYAATSATAALILSLVGLLCCQPIAIVSLILAQQALAITQSSPGHPDHGSARAAQIISWVAIALLLLAIAYYAWLFMMFSEGTTGRGF